MAPVAGVVASRTLAPSANVFRGAEFTGARIHRRSTGACPQGIDGKTRVRLGLSGRKVGRDSVSAKVKGVSR